MRAIDNIWIRLLSAGIRAREESGEGLVTWVVLAVGLAAAAAAVVAIVTPAVREAAQHVVSEITGS